MAATASTPDIAASGETELSTTALVADHRPADLVALQLVTTSGIVVTPSQRSIEPFVLLSAVAGSCLLFWAVAGAMAATAVLLVGSCTAALDRRRRATPGDSWLDPHRLVAAHIAGVPAGAVHERRVLNVVLDYADGASTTELCTLLARLGRLG